MGMRRFRKACRPPVLQAASEALDNADDKAILSMLRTGETHHSCDKYIPLKDDGASVRGPCLLPHTVRAASLRLNHPTWEVCSAKTRLLKQEELLLFTPGGLKIRSKKRKEAFSLRSH